MSACCSCRGPQFPALGFGGSQLPIHTSLEGLPDSSGLHGDPYLHVWGKVMVHWAQNRIVWSKIAPPSCCGLNRKCSQGLSLQPGCWCCLGVCGIFRSLSFTGGSGGFMIMLYVLRVDSMRAVSLLYCCHAFLVLCLLLGDTKFLWNVSQSKPLCLKLV